MSTSDTRIVCENSSPLVFKKLPVRVLLVFLSILGLVGTSATMAPSADATDVPDGLVAGPTLDLGALIVASGPEAREAGIDAYRVQRVEGNIVVDLLAGDGVVATVRKSCACGGPAASQRLSIEASGNLLEIRSKADRQDWSLNGRALSVPSGAAARSDSRLLQLARSETEEFGVLQALQIVSREQDLGVWAEDAQASSRGLMSCPACPSATTSALFAKDRLEQTPSLEERAGFPGGFDCGKRGGWSCSFQWNVSTSERIMQNTRFECGGGLTIGGLFTVIPGVCGDWSHTQPESYVDVAGGISQACDDHSSSFYGPLGGEWNGCTIAYQQSTGVQNIESVNQGANYWPFPGNQHWSWDVPGCVSFLQPPPPPTVLLAPGSHTVTPAFASIYDLDTCTFKQLAGTIYWDPFTVTAQRTVDQPFYKVTEVVGSAPTQCASQVEACENALLCSDLIVRGIQLCTFDYDEPMTRCDQSCSW